MGWDFDAYQQAALRTATAAGQRTHNERLANWALGLTGEAGEIAESIKKHLFHGHELNHDALVKEMGDVLWYLAVLASEIGVELHEVAETNIAKLRRRYPEGFTAQHSIHRQED